MSQQTKGAVVCILASTVLSSAYAVAGQSAPAIDPCAILSDADVAAVLGQPVKSKKQSNLGPGPKCMWRGASSNLMVGIETEESFKAFNAAHPEVRPIDLPPLERMRSFRKTLRANAVDVQGLGEEAFWDKSNKQLWFIKKGRGVIVNIDRHNAFGMADDLEGAKAAALRIAPKL
jgi:hypothetical protein